MFADKCDETYCQGGICTIENHNALCTCPTGFDFVNNVCEDINECLDNPCQLNANCVNNRGSYTCSCVNGTILDASTGNCRSPGECFSDSDCSEKTKCNNNYCIDPCEKSSPCGENAECIVSDHNPVCECPSDSQGDPYKKCTKFECIQDSDCPSEEACVNYKCKNSCSIPRACGKNADCLSRNHIGHCSCSSGFTGDPVLGCVPIQYCTDDRSCSSGTKCVDNLCVGKLKIHPKINKTFIFEKITYLLFFRFVQKFKRLFK